MLPQDSLASIAKAELNFLLSEPWTLHNGKLATGWCSREHTLAAAILWHWFNHPLGVVQGDVEIQVPDQPRLLCASPPNGHHWCTPTGGGVVDLSITFPRTQVLAAMPEPRGAVLTAGIYPHFVDPYHIEVILSADEFPTRSRPTICYRPSARSCEPIGVLIKQRRPLGLDRRALDITCACAMHVRAMISSGRAALPRRLSNDIALATVNAMHPAAIAEVQRIIGQG